MQRSLAQLKNEARKLGLNPDKFTGPGGKEAKRDWINVLGNYHQGIIYGQNVPWGLKMRREMESPMLAFLFSNLKEEEQKSIFKSDEWVFEEKIDGCRMTLFYDGKGGKWAFSRNISVKDYLPVEYTDKIDFPELDFLEAPLIVDCEVQCSSKDISYELEKRGIEAATILDATNSILSLNTAESLELQKKYPLNFIAFDIVHFHTNLMEKPWEVRRKNLEKVFDLYKEKTGGSERFILNSVFTEQKEIVLNEILDRGGEGVVAKNTKSLYTATNSRGRKRWVKIKRKVSSTIGDFRNEDYVDAYVCGATPGKEGSAWENLVGSLDLAVSLIMEDGSEKEHVIARVSNIPMEMRKRITIYKDGKPELSPDFYNTVFEIDGQDISSKSYRFSHAIIIRIREDKSPFECVMEEKELKGMVF